MQLFYMEWVHFKRIHALERLHGFLPTSATTRAMMKVLYSVPLL